MNSNPARPASERIDAVIRALRKARTDLETSMTARTMITVSANELEDIRVVVAQLEANPPRPPQGAPE